MKFTNFRVFLSLGMVGFSIPSAPHALAEVPVHCDLVPKLREMVESPVDDARAKMMKNWKNLDPATKKGFIAKARDDLRYWLEVKHGHNYPTSVLVGDAATPLNAYAYAKNAIHELTSEQSAVLSADDLKAITDDLTQEVKSAQNFHQERAADLDQISSMVAEREWITEKLANKKTKAYGIDETIPVVTSKNPDALTDGYEVSSKPDYAGYRAQLDIRKNELKKQIDHRLQGFYIPSEDPNLLQVYRLKKLEVYYHELTRQLRAKSLTAFDDPATQEIYTQIKALYDVKPDGSVAGFLPQYSPPGWAWDRLHWAWLWGETKAVLMKDIPTLKTTVENSKLMDFAKTITPEEQKVILGNNFSTSLAWWKRSPIGTAILGMTSAGSITEVGHVVYDYVFNKRISYNDITTTEDSSEAAAKIRDYLSHRYSADGLWSPDHKLINKDAIAEVEKIYADRKSVLKFNGAKAKEAEQANILALLPTWSDADSLSKKRVIYLNAKKEFKAAEKAQQGTLKH